MDADWRDHVGSFLIGDVWTVFLVGAEQVAAWSDGELIVHRSGPWDQQLEALPHTRVPWSWLSVGLEDERGGTGLDVHHPLTAALVATTDEDELIAWLEPVGADSLSVFAVVSSASGPPRSSSRKYSDQLLVFEPIAQALLEADGDQPAQHQWWSMVLDRIGAKYDLGDRSNFAGRPAAPASPIDADELRILVGPDIHVPEGLLDSISSALIGLGADVDDWVGHAEHVGLPIAGPDIPLYMRHGAAIARAAGYVVLHP